MRTLGWDATQALATMRELLNAKSSFVRLEASKDLMDRAGLRNDAPVSHSTAVQINFNVDQGVPSAKRTYYKVALKN